MRDFIGTIRIYSLIDFVLFLLVLDLSYLQIFGFCFIHIGFLFFLEYQHKHSYRKSFHWSLFIIFYIVGILLSGKYIPALLFILFGYFYSKKSTGYFSIFSPVFRELQYYSISYYFLNPIHFISLLSLILIFVRNILGDFRDIEKDKVEDMKTIPILLGFNKNIKNAHLVGLFMTTLIWGLILDISYLILMIIFLIQFFSYSLTKR